MKRKKGRPPLPRDEQGNIIRPPKPPDEPEEPEDDDVDTSAVEWARAVMWALKNISRKGMTPSKAGSRLRYSLWRIGREDEGRFSCSMVPKALDIIEKAKAAQAAAGLVDTPEEVAVKEIDELIEAAIEEAKHQ